MKYIEGMSLHHVECDFTNIFSKIAIILQDMKLECNVLTKKANASFGHAHSPFGQKSMKIYYKKVF